MIIWCLLYYLLSIKKIIVDVVSRTQTDFVFAHGTDVLQAVVNKT